MARPITKALRFEFRFCVCLLTGRNGRIIIAIAMHRGTLKSSTFPPSGLIRSCDRPLKKFCVTVRLCRALSNSRYGNKYNAAIFSRSLLSADYRLACQKFCEYYTAEKCWLSLTSELSPPKARQMSFQIRFTREAKEDLIRLFQFLAERDLAANEHDR